METDSSSAGLRTCAGDAYRRGEYAQARDLYTEALAALEREAAAAGAPGGSGAERAALHVNRAMANLKLMQGFEDPQAHAVINLAELAVWDCDAAVAAEPNKSKPLYHRARARWQLGRRAAALDDVRAALLLAPGNGDLSYGARLAEVFTAFFPLGFLAFGGPQAHVAMFLKTFVEEKRWLDEQRFLELMSLGQAMPGPTSTQMACALGISRAGWLGGLVSFFLFDWVGFAVCIVVGSLVYLYLEGNDADQATVDAYREAVVGMGPAAISQVFLAAYTLGIKACGTDRLKVGLASVTCFVALLLPSSLIAAFVYLGMMLLGGIITVIDSRRPSRAHAYPPRPKDGVEDEDGFLRHMGMPPLTGYVLALIALVLLAVPWWLVLSPDVAYPSTNAAQLFALWQTLYRMGITIYGGGQVVLPMLENEFVNRCGDSPNYVDDFPGTAAAAGGCSWVSAETFAFGLALAQSLPGPLFNFSAFLGAAYLGAAGGFVGFLGLFGPGVMLIYAFMPFWDRLRRRHWTRCLLVGMNASSIGLVFTACVKLYASYVRNFGEAVIMLLAMVLVRFYGVKAPLAIIGCAGLGWAFYVLDLGGPYCHVPTYGNYMFHDPARCTRR